MQPRKFYLDTQSRAFVGSPDSTLPTAGTAFFEEDVEAIELYFLEPTGNFSAPYQFLDYSGNTVKLAVGVTAPAALQTSWTSVSTTVTATITELVVGGSGATEVQRISFSPRAEKGSFAIQFPSRNVTVSSATSSIFAAARHGLFDGQSVTLTAFTISSGFSNGDILYIRDRTRDTFKVAAQPGATAITFSLTSGGGTAQLPAQTTAQLAYDVPPLEMQDAISDAGYQIDGAEQITVTGTAGREYLLNYGGDLAGISFANVTLVGSTLARQPGLAANVSFNTSEIVALVAAGNTATTMEVEVGDGTLRQTYQQAATLGNDIIATSSPVPLPNPTPASSFNLIAPNSDVWTVTIDNDGVLTATKQ